MPVHPFITTGRRRLLLVRCHGRAEQNRISPPLRVRACVREFLLLCSAPPSSPSLRHGAPPRQPRLPVPRRRRVSRVRVWPPRRRGREGAQGRVLRGDVPRRGGGGAGGHGARARARGPQRRLRHAPPVPRLLRQRVRRVGADGRDVDDAGGEGGALQHQLAPLLRGRGRAQGGRGGALPRRRLLRRHHRHGLPRRRLPDRWTPLGREAGARGQPDGEPGGLGQHHAEPARQREHAHHPLRRLQPQRHGPRRALGLALHRRGPLLLHHVPPLQPVGLRPARPAHGPGLPRRARRALPADGRPERHRRDGQHPRRLRQPVLQGPRPPPRLPQLRPDALLRQPLHAGGGEQVQRGPGRLLQGLRRGDGQDGRAPEPQEGRDSGQLPRRQRRAAPAEEESSGRALPAAGLLISGY